MRKTILIADDDTDVLDLMRRRCQTLGARVIPVKNAIEAIASIEEHRPDVVLLDVDMPGGNGLSVCEMMMNHEELHGIPVIMLTGSTNEETVRRCHQLSAYYVLKCPELWSRVEPILKEILKTGAFEMTTYNHHLETVATDTSRILDAVFAMLGSEEGDTWLDSEAPAPAETQAPWVLSIDDDEDFALALQIRLQECGMRVLRAGAAMDGCRRAFSANPQAIILDYEMPDANGDYVLRRLKESKLTREIPVIVLTGSSHPHVEQQMRTLGASEFLRKPVDWPKLRRAVEQSLSV